MNDRRHDVAKTFGDAKFARGAVQTLHAALVAKRGLFFEFWKSEYSQAIGRDLDTPSPALEKLAKLYGLSKTNSRPAEPLFALHTYFAIVLKCLAAKAVDEESLAAVVSAKSGDERKRRWRRIEAGEVFHAAGLTKFLEGDPFGWCGAHWSGAIDELVKRLTEMTLAASLAEIRNAQDDPLGRLHHALVPRAVRQELGEYYTPAWLVEHLLDVLEYGAKENRSLLDPSCGSGVFLLSSIRRLIAGGEGLSHILKQVAGFDLNPLAALAARTNYLLAIADLLPSESPIEIPVYCLDSILGADDPIASRFRDGVDVLVGNPPWTAWDRLPDAVRQATRPLWERYGLFSLSGAEARHGGAKKDLSSLFLYACADAYLKRGGKLGFVITQTLFQSKAAGDGFRRFRLGAEGELLRVLRVDDFSSFQPFDGASNWSSAVLLAKGESTTYPVPYYVWSLGSDQEPFEIEARTARPIDSDKITSPWSIAPPGLSLDLNRFAAPSHFRAQLGANAGGASGVYWLKIVVINSETAIVENFPQAGKRAIAFARGEIETELLYPLLRWGDVGRWRAAPAAYLLLVQDPTTRTGIPETRLAREFPLAYRWLAQFRPALEARAAWRRYQESGPFYSMYNVGASTIAPIKVVWRRMDKRINAVVVEEIDDPHLGRRAPIPQETCSLVAASSLSEAHYLCAVLNSSPANFLAASYSVRGGKGFGTPSMLDYLPIERYDETLEIHRELANTSLLAHRAAADGGDLAPIEGQIDALVAKLWRLSQSDAQIMRNSL